MDIYKRFIVKNKDPLYYTIINREQRYKTHNYFHQVNRWEILPRWIKEKRLFNASDLEYIKEIVKK